MEFVKQLGNVSKAGYPIGSKGDGSSPLSLYLYYVAFSILVALQLCPIWFTDYPAMHDYPNHLARAHIVYQYTDVASYRTTYELEWQPLPNLAMDVIIPALLNWVSVETASKLFLSLTVLFFNLGIHALGLAIDGHPRWIALAATFFSYNFAFSYGFVNYIFGLGAFFIALATWLRMRHVWNWHRVSIMAVLAFLCYFSHLSSLVFLTIAIGALTLLRLALTRRFERHALMGLLPLVPAAAVYLIYSSGIKYRAPMEWWNPIVTKKLIGLLYPFISHDLVLDAALSAALLLLLAIVYIGHVATLSSKEMALIGTLFLGFYFLAPMSGGAQSTYIDRRFLIPAVVCLILSLQIDVSRRLGRYVMIALLVLSMGRSGVVWRFWTRVSHEIQTQVHLLDRLPDGIKLYPMFVHDDSALATWPWDMNFFYAAHYATIYRHAFVPTLYAWDSVNPLHLRVGHTGYAQIERGTAVGRVNWDEIFSRYDYLWGYKLSEDYKRHLPDHADLVAQAGDAMLFKIRK